MEDKQITITAQDMAQASAFLALVESGKLHEPTVGASALGSGLSYSRLARRQPMRPDAARALAKITGDEARARRYLHGREAVQAFAQPDVSEVHVDAVLTEILVQWINTAYVGRQIFPSLQVDKPSGTYFTFNKGEWFLNDAQVRAPGSRAAGGGYGVTRDTYSCVQYAREKQVEDEVRQAADAPLDPYTDATRFVGDRMSQKVEQLVSDLVFGTGAWTTQLTLSGTSQWSHASSDPFAAVSTARLAIHALTGILPNTLVLGLQVYEKLALHAGLLDRVKYTGTGANPAMVTAAMMAQLFQVDQVLIGSSLVNSAAEGYTPTLAYVWGKRAWLGYVTPGASREKPSAGYVFTLGSVVDTYREESVLSDYVRVREELDVKKVAADIGYLFIDAVA